MIRNVSYAIISISYLANGAFAAELDEMLNRQDILASMIGCEITVTPARGKEWATVFDHDGTFKDEYGREAKWFVKDDYFCVTNGSVEYCRTLIKIDDRRLQSIHKDGSTSVVYSY